MAHKLVKLDELSLTSASVVDKCNSPTWKEKSRVPECLTFRPIKFITHDFDLERIVNLRLR